MLKRQPDSGGAMLLGKIQTEELPINCISVGYADRAVIGKRRNREGRRPINKISGGLEPASIRTSAR